MRIVLLGAPGSGKRIQTKRIVEKYGIPAICTGELLKDAVTQGGELGDLVQEAMDAGRSVSEEVVLELIHARLLKPDAQGGFVLDGFPRNILQAITLDELLMEIGQPIELALLLDIDTDALMERLVGRRTCTSCGTQYNIFVEPTLVDGVCDVCGGHLRQRADDNEETVSNRLHIYEHLSSPLIKHYGKQQKLRRVDGVGEIDEVFASIRQTIDGFEPPSVVTEVDSKPELGTLEVEDLSSLSAGDPMKQLIPTGLEEQQEKEEAPAATGPGKKPTPRRAKKQASKPAAKSKKKTVKKKTAKKRAATSKKVKVDKKPTAKKKTPLKKPSAVKKATKKSGPKDKAVQKKPAKKLPVKKRVVKAAKKKAAGKKTTSGRKSAAKKKAASKKRAK